jgi:hypothetical protein
MTLGTTDALMWFAGPLDHSPVEQVPLFKNNPRPDHHVLIRLIYNTNPNHFDDKVDGECVMPWFQAAIDKPPEFIEAVKQAHTFLTAQVPQAEIIKFLGKDHLLGTMGHFTWSQGKEWLVETDLGNFIWSDPNYGDGDDTLTFFEGGHDEFYALAGVQPEVCKDKGDNLILNKCGQDIDLKIPQIDS